MHLVLLAILCVLVYSFLDWLLRSLTVSHYDRKYVLVTGCDSGFGQILALRLDKLGFHVFAGCLTTDGQASLKKEGSEKLRPFHLNVGSEDSIEEAVDLVKQALPQEEGLWALVNNAGVKGELGPPDLNTVKGVEDTLRVNLYGPMEMCRHFLPLIRKSKGRVVNMTSMCGRVPAAEGPYCASKYGLEGYSDILRRELYNQGVKVCIVEPDYYKTNILKVDHTDLTNRFKESSEEVQAAYGHDFLDFYIYKVDQVVGESSLDLNPVINAYLHAITSRFPRTRYVVGLRAKFFFIPMSYIPDWILNSVIPKLIAKRLSKKS